jgi:hypothetical protein
MRAFGVAANAPQFRATPTLALNFAVRKQLGQRWSLGFGPALSAALASYELHVDPARGLGSLPNLWLTGAVGLERTLL